jgi:hypothetical protein
MRSVAGPAAVAAALLLAGCVQPGASACTAPLRPAVEVDLYFGLDKPGGGQVSEAEWTQFLADTVTPRFPDGLSVLNVEGQWRAPSGQIVHDRTKLLVIVVFDAPAHQSRIGEVVAVYRQRFSQQSVFRTEHPVCAAA